MKKIDYITREDGEPKLIMDEFGDLMDTDLLLEDYSYILSSLNKEGHHIENGLCNIFDEIIYENKVVGFAAFETRNERYLLLNECYILPEFRGKRLFFDEICKMNFVGSNLGILEPTRKLVELLIDYSFAKKATENIVISAIPFHFHEVDVTSNKNADFDEEDLKPTHFYDLSICSSISVEDDEILYHDMLENDVMEYGQREQLTDEYFKNIFDLFDKNKEEFDKIIEEVKNELPQVEFGFNEVVGSGEELSEFMMAIVDDGYITYDEALNYKKQLTEEYESGKLTDDDDFSQRLGELIHEESLGDYNQFLELVGENEDIPEANVIKEFFDVVGDDDNLGMELLNALANDDFSRFEQVISNAMSQDLDFMENFLALADKYGDDEDFINSNQLDFFDLDDEIKNYKLDDTVYGKDYPKSYDLDIYHILEALEISEDYDIVMEIVDLESSLNFESLTDLLIDSNFIKSSGRKIDWISSASEFKKTDLQKILKDNGLKISGNKAKLLERLAENNVTLDDNYTLTPEGKKYLEEFSWIALYDNFLYDFDFDDFYKYMENHEYGSIIDLSISYIDEHIERAYESGDDDYLKDCLFNKKIIQNEAEQFIHDLNNPE